MIGKENAMLFSNETIGHVFTVENERHKYITKDMRKETLEKNQSNGLFQFVNLAMINNIEKNKKPNAQLLDHNPNQARSLVMNGVERYLRQHDSYRD